MTTIEYNVKDALGLHARPAGLLVKLAKSYPGARIYVEKDGRRVQATQLLMLMGLAIHQDDHIIVRVDAPEGEEQEVAQAVEAFLRDNL